MAGKKEKAEKVISAIQKRWGRRIIGRSKGALTQPIAHIPTGFPQLDKALGIGGIPRGRISELLGAPTSGMATVALKIISHAQQRGGMTVYLDVGQTFDPDFALRCGVRLENLRLIRPHNLSQALAILVDLIINGGIELLIFDLPVNLQSGQVPAPKFTASMGRLLAPLSKSGGTLIFLTSLRPLNNSLAAYSDQVTLPHFATVRLLLQKERWLYEQQDVRGYEAQAWVIKNKLARPGQKVRFGITFNGTVDGDSL